ncbi:MAG: hypothetical protein OQJ91_03540 [Motiliproteus sp.]|nr:hypothetical protein [Motiliproteus sp.]
MRWFFLILLVLNIALYAWFQQEQELRDRVANRVEFSGADVEPIRLLSEMPIQLRKRSAANQSDKSVRSKDRAAGGANVTEDQCLVISGFPSVESARTYLLDQLSADYQGRVVQLSESVIDYWVYVRAPEGLHQLQKTQQSLQDQGVEVSVARQGALKGQLSLGLFQRKELALALYESLKKRNFDVDVFELPRQKMISAIQLSGKKEGVIDVTVEQKVIAELILQDAYLKSEKKLCERLASG